MPAQVGGIQKRLRHPAGQVLQSAEGAKQDGGDEEDRTPDLGIANAALSQLSYVPIPEKEYKSWNL